MEQKLKPKQIRCIDLMVHRTDLNNEGVCKEVDIHPATFYRWLQDASFCETLEKETRKYLQALGAQAMKKIVKLSEDDSISADVRFRAAKDLMDRAGYKPSDKIENIGEQPSYVFNIIGASPVNDDESTENDE